MTHNPFSSRRIRPGAIPYHSVTGESPRAIAERFRLVPEGRGLIVGAHGTGKSTLLHGMIPWLGRVVEAINIPSCEAESLGGSMVRYWPAAGGRSGGETGVGSVDGEEGTCGTGDGGGGDGEVYWVRLQVGRRTPKGVWGWLRRVGAKSLVVVDGMEQWHRWQVRWYVWSLGRRGARLLGTSHREMDGIPTLVRTGLGEEVASWIWEWLVREVPAGEMREKMERAWRASRARWPDQIRESLWEMYDWMEAEHG